MNANNKGANQPAHPRSLISVFVVRCLDSIIPVVSTSEISSLHLASVAAQAGLSLTWSQTRRQGRMVLWWQTAESISYFMVCNCLFACLFVCLFVWLCPANIVITSLGEEGAGHCAGSLLTLCGFTFNFSSSWWRRNCTPLREGGLRLWYSMWIFSSSSCSNVESPMRRKNAFYDYPNIPCIALKTVLRSNTTTVKSIE